MQPARICLVAMLLFSAPARADGWAFTPQTPEQAAMVSTFGFYPTRRLELRLAYLDIRDGGNATSLVLRITLPMPYVLVPGLRISNWYSLLRIDVPVILSASPKVDAVGLADTPVIDGTVIPIKKRAAVGFGLSMRLPTATNPAFGTGKLLIGPAGGAAAWIVKPILSVSVLIDNLWSVAGNPMRKDVNLMEVQPAISLNLPYAFYLLFDPIWRFDWTQAGKAIIPINLNVGHAFSKRLVIEAGPEWVTTGMGQNDVQIRLIFSYLGW